MQRSDFRHILTLPIRWGDMDALGHVNNVEYLRYFECGRIDYIDTVQPPGLPPAQHPVIVDVQCRFRRQLHYPSTLEIGTRIERLGRRSMGYQAAIFVQGEYAPAATSNGVLVWYDFAEHRSVTVPEALRRAIVEFEPIPPQS